MESITIGLGTAILLFFIWFIFAFGCYSGSAAQYKNIIKAPKFPIKHGDAAGQAGRMLVYIDRLEAAQRGGDWTRVCDGKEFKYYFEKADREYIAMLVLWAHKLGCEVVVRQISDSDIEDESNRGDVFWEYLGELTEKHFKKWEKQFYREFKD